MSLFNWNNKKTEAPVEYRNTNPILSTLKFALYGSSDTTAMKSSTVYRCVNLISDSIASLPLLPYNYTGNWKIVDVESLLYNLFNVQPNAFMSAYTFKKMLVISMLLKGNAYVAITRDNRTGEVSALTLLNSDTVLMETTTNDFKYVDTSTGNVYDKSQIIHLMNYGSSMYKGESTISYMANSLAISNNLENYLLSLTRSGMMVSGILKPTANAGGGMTSEKAIKAKQSFNSAINSVEANSVIVLDAGFDFQQISISPKDAKYLESSKLNSNTICKFFGVPPSMIYDEVGKYSTAEQSQLDYLNNTLTPIIEKIESEFFRKIYLQTEWNNKELKFDTTNLMRLDATTQASYFKTLFEMGAMTVNEVRERINAAYPATNGNKHFISTNLQPLDSPIVVPIDNKLKQ
jgi:HK97 family phage portal protein